MNKFKFLPWLFVVISISAFLPAMAISAENISAVSTKPIDWAWWFAVVTGGLSFAISTWTAHRQRRGPTDVKIHEERIKQYQAIITSTAPLAVYFPPADSKGKSRLSADDCMKMGQAAREWYFAHGGLLMSSNARDAYMRFARGLTLASQASAPLAVPQYPKDAPLVTVGQLDDYRSLLLKEIAPNAAAAAIQKPLLQPLKNLWKFILNRLNQHATASSRAAYALAADDIITKWQFGAVTPASAPPHQRFRDYVLLQNLSSKLRTTLAEDLRSRRRPE